MVTGGPFVHPQARRQRCRRVARTCELAPGHELHRHPEEAGEAACAQAGPLLLDGPPHPLRADVDAEHEVGEAGLGRGRRPARQAAEQPPPPRDLPGPQQTTANQDAPRNAGRGRGYEPAHLPVDPGLVGFGDRRVVGQPDRQERREVVAGLAPSSGGEFAIPRPSRPSGHGERGGRKQPLPQRQGHLEMRQERGERLERLARQPGDESPKALHAQQLEPAVERRGLLPDRVERAVAGAIFPGGDALVVGGGEMFADLLLDDRRPVAAAAPLHDLGQRPQPGGIVGRLEFGLGISREQIHDRRRVEPSRSGDAVAHQFVDGRVDVGGGESTSKPAAAEVGKRGNCLAGRDRAEKLPRGQPVAVDEAEKRVHRHVVGQRPDRRHEPARPHDGLGQRLIGGDRPQRCRPWRERGGPTATIAEQGHGRSLRGRWGRGL